jgi:hypothetical protein
MGDFSLHPQGRPRPANPRRWAIDTDVEPMLYHSTEPVWMTGRAESSPL